MEVENPPASIEQWYRRAMALIEMERKQKRRREVKGKKNREKELLSRSKDK